MGRKVKKKLTQRRTKTNSLKKNIWKNKTVQILKYSFIFCFVIPIIVAIVVVYNFVTASDLFKIKEIDISGNKRVLSNTIARFVSLQNKKRIYQVDIDKVAEDIVKLASVKNAVVRRDLPNKISIDIQEHKAFAIAKYKRKFYEIDVNGIAIAEYNNPLRLLNVPVINGVKDVKSSNVILGSPIDSIKLKIALFILKTAFTSDVAIYFNIKKIDVRNLRQIIIDTDKGFEIYLTNDKIEIKFKKLAALIKENEKDVLSAKYIDLRFNSINIKPRR